MSSLAYLFFSSFPESASPRSINALLFSASGRFNGLRGPGIYYLIPLLERQQKVDIRTNTVTLEQQETITKDSVTIKVNAVLWFRITNPEDAIIKVTIIIKRYTNFP
jgi:regulator of protease activity HflC (stomatin/prohibitin superfamily)